ncbi:MAG: PD40 domain-containing protein [Candidatus Aminicenantes bacterium]|nr:PD40 domain-containing protein [Candidatus Aminicenantes bacterium]
MLSKIYKTSVFISILLISGFNLNAQVDARMLRYPDVSYDQICFIYAGDIWVVPKAGGLASRLSSPPGEESFPRFSPDGSKIVFSGNYDGNTDLYVIPAMGGTPERLTFHGMPDRVLDWYPDGNMILYASYKESGRSRFNQFFSINAKGGLPQKLPIPYGEFGSISPDGKTLAYIPIARDFRTWKRYRGGMAPDIWLFDLTTYEASNITNHVANDTQPMWNEDELYFLSDRGPYSRHNIWKHNVKNKKTEQITRFKDFDIHFPAIGSGDMVFEAGGRLYLLDLNSKETKEVKIQIVTDMLTMKPRFKNVSKLITNIWTSPQGKRVLIEARGELFDVPAEKGVIKNITRSSGIAERYPAWSPDGKQIAYWSDRSGEYQLTIRSLDCMEKETRLTSFKSGYGYQPYWSPDSKKIVFIDQAMRIRLYDLNTKKLKDVDQGLWMYHYGLTYFRVSWSSDSRWLAYGRGIENRNGAIFLYDTTESKKYQVTSGYYYDYHPAFDPEGKYLYFFSNRTFQPAYSDLDNSFIYSNTTNVVAVSLRSDIPSILAPENDKDEAKKKGEKEPEDKNKTKDNKKKKETKKPVEIDLKDFETRLVVLPAKAGNYYLMEAAPGKIVYMKIPRTGSGEQGNTLVYYDIKDRKEQTVITGIDGYRLTYDKKKVLVTAKGKLAVLELKEKQKMEKIVPTAGLEIKLNPAQEWNQIFNDVWRLARDYFYDADMHGVDWAKVRDHYSRLLRNVVTRRDLNFVIGEMIAELNASHTYRGGGDIETASTRKVGYLGINWTVDKKFYRVEEIIKGAVWDTEVRSPLSESGVKIKEGDYILAVNGIPLKSKQSPYAAFQGLEGHTVELTFNEKPTWSGAKKAVIKTLKLRQEMRLRHLNWIESNRKFVDKLSSGKVGYIYVRSTGIDGQNELVRQFRAQFHKDGLIIDERFNSGGQIPDRFIELLDRKPLAFWAVRDGATWQWPPVGHFGPKVMLINGWSGSGGDAFPDYFRKAGLGPLIGMRTWGGLIGITGAPRLIDGGGITIPTFRMYDPDGKWFKEGHGVDPDIEVVDHPTELARGTDPQLKRAVEEVLRLIKEKPPVRPKNPPREDRSK